MVFGFFYSAVPHKMCSSNKICTVLMKKLFNSKVYYFVVQGCKKVNSSKNDRFRYEMIDDTQPDIELIEVLTLNYPFLLKGGS